MKFSNHLKKEKFMMKQVLHYFVDYRLIILTLISNIIYIIKFSIYKALLEMILNLMISELHMNIIDRSIKKLQNKIYFNLSKNIRRVNKKSKI